MNASEKKLLFAVMYCIATFVGLVTNATWGVVLGVAVCFATWLFVFGYCFCTIVAEVVKHIYWSTR